MNYETVLRDLQQIAAHMGQRQDQHGDNSRDIGWNSASGAYENEDEVREYQQV